MASAPSPVTSTPGVPGQPWDATSNATVGKWVSVDSGSGPADMNGRVTGEFPGDADWKQT